MDENGLHAERIRKKRRLHIEYTIAALIVVVFLMLLYGMVKPVWEMLSR